jgi:hypothetical protein
MANKNYKELKMKRVMVSFMCVLMAAMVLLNGCVSPPNFSEMKINVPSDYSRSILNLQNASNLNATWKQWSERLMKSGFLDTSTEEYGYFEVELDYRNFQETDTAIMAFLSVITLFIGYPVWALLGIPTGNGWCTIYASLTIYDSNKNLVKSYYESKFVEKYAGLYYSGDMTKKAGKEFEKLFKTILDTAKMESSQINRALREAGPVTAEKERIAAERIAAERREAREREANRPTPAPSYSYSDDSPSSDSSGVDVGKAIADAFKSPLQSGTYSLAGTQAKIRLTSIAKSGVLSYTNRQGGTGTGTYSIDGNRMTIQMEGYTFVYIVTSETSFRGDDGTWVRTGF